MLHGSILACFTKRKVAGQQSKLLNAFKLLLFLKKQHLQSLSDDKYMYRGYRCKLLHVFFIFYYTDEIVNCRVPATIFKEIHSIRNCWIFLFSNSIYSSNLFLFGDKKGDALQPCIVLLLIVIYRQTISTECRCILSKMLSHMRYSDYSVYLLSI